MHEHTLTIRTQLQQKYDQFHRRIQPSYTLSADSCGKVCWTKPGPDADVIFFPALGSIMSS